MYPKRIDLKNTNRSSAALGRKRDGNGKFLDGRHRSKFERQFDRKAIFKITRVER